MIDTITLVAELSLLEKAALLSGANTWQTRAIERVGLPAVWLADGPHGVRKQVGSADHLGINGSEPATCFPTAATVACSWDDELAEEIGTALGREASSQGVGVVLGPGLNIKRSPLGGRNFEYFSEDPELSGRLAAANVRGIQSAGVAATPKHFAVNSQELRRMVSDSVLDERTLREIYLTAFEIVVREAAPWGIMSSYNLVNGVYAHENPHLLLDILRAEWDFDGAVVSDWGGGNDAVDAVAAGGTLEMPSPGFDSARQIVAAVESGRLAVADLDARVAELVGLINRVTAQPTATVDLDAHHALARRAAAESAVLLRNEDGLLPLAAGAGVALIGPFATVPRFQGAGSSLVNATRVTTLATALEASPVSVVGVAEGFRRDGRPDKTLRDEAIALARRAEVVVLALGLPEIAESEGLDRSNLALPEDQVILLREIRRVNPKTVVVLSAGGVVETPWIGETAALLHAYLGGQAGAEGIADVLTGAVDPSGRLAETMPLALSDTPTAEHFPGRGRTVEYREGPFVGYRFYETAEIPVAFPFGFGLSYTTFAYRDLVVDSDGARVTVANTGNRAGSEVVQLYIGRIGGSGVLRPVRELKGYVKVRLEPGESRRVSLPFGERTFRFFDAPSDSWRVEAGRYEVAVGSHVRALALRTTIERDGVTLPPLPAVVALASLPHVGGMDDTAFTELLGRPIPDARSADGPLSQNDPMERLADARSPLGRFFFRILDGRRRKAETAGMPDLNILFLLNGPFRVISKMSGGLATRRLTLAILTLVNGQTFRGLCRVVAAFFGGWRDERVTRKAFYAAATKRSQ
ncbi:beta-glucosidase [Microbacterium sp. 22303]|uniref:beta-glucosidase family protein n=1 Tax=Microbacterium sp. 22303 TaxID=3453905 RepID=UPI003F83E279